MKCSIYLEDLKKSNTSHHTNSFSPEEICNNYQLAHGFYSFICTDMARSFDNTNSFLKKTRNRKKVCYATPTIQAVSSVRIIKQIKRLAPFNHSLPPAPSQPFRAPLFSLAKSLSLHSHFQKSQYSQGFVHGCDQTVTGGELAVHRQFFSKQ